MKNENGKIIDRYLSKIVLVLNSSINRRTETEPHIKSRLTFKVPINYKRLIIEICLFRLDTKVEPPDTDLKMRLTVSLRDHLTLKSFKS